MTIRLIERELVGGECSYWACTPTRAMLRPLEALAAARLAPETETETVPESIAVVGQRLLLVAGRRANTDGLGLERLGVTIGERGVEVDERMQAVEGVWALGDVAGIAMFTHVGKSGGSGIRTHETCSHA